MGAASDATAVVDGGGRVHGVDSLRVVDASIFVQCIALTLHPHRFRTLGVLVRGEVAGEGWARGAGWQTQI